MKTARSCETNRNFVTEFSRSHYDFLKRGDFVVNVEIGLFQNQFSRLSFVWIGAFPIQIPDYWFSERMPFLSWFRDFVAGLKRYIFYQELSNSTKLDTRVYIHVYAFFVLIQVHTSIYTFACIQCTLHFLWAIFSLTKMGRIVIAVCSCSFLIKL